MKTLGFQIKFFLKTLIPQESVRSHLRTILTSSTSVFRQIYLEAVYKNQIRKVEGHHLLVNIGCGDLNHPNWVNIDKTTRKGVYYADLLDGNPLRDGTARHIHCEHFLEHLDYSHAKQFLSECYRILESGGSVRLVVPDAEKYIRAYCSNDEEFFEKLKFLGGSAEPLRTKIEIINRMFRMWGCHQFAWDFETLSMALGEAGFTEIQKSEYGDIGEELNIDGDDSWRRLESLYVNAKK